MCEHSDNAPAALIGPRHGEQPPAPHHHSHDHDHAHGHGHEDGTDHDRGTCAGASPARDTAVRVEQEVLAKNNRLAERNRGWLAGRDILALNLVSSPGAGKTTLL